MHYTFVNLQENSRGQEISRLRALDPEFNDVWKDLTGKRMATQKQLSALSVLVNDSRTNENVVKTL